MLRGVVERGTGKRARRDGLDRAGKTGTTNDAVDTWFVGSTPAHTVAVWVGSDEPEGLGRGEAGGRTALPGWTHIVDALPTDPDARFERPAEVLLAPDAQGVVRVFRRGTTPGSVLPLHSLRGQEPLPPFPGAPGHGALARPAVRRPAWCRGRRAPGPARTPRRRRPRA